MDTTALPLSTNISNATNATSSAMNAVFVESIYSRVFRLFMFTVSGLVSLVGNTMVIYITYNNKFMRTFAYFLIANLAVSDVLSTLILPFMVFYLEIGKWTFGETLCKILNPCFTVFAVVTTNTLVAIACDRFRALLFPFKLKPSTSETRLILAIIWLLAFLVSLPSFGSRTIDAQGYCLEIYSNDPQEHQLYLRIYTVFLFLFNNFIPLVVILYLYIRITMALKHISFRPQTFQLNRPSSLAGRESPGSSPRNSVVLRNANVASANKRQKMESKFIRMLAMVVLVFFFCYVPFQVFFLLYTFIVLPMDSPTYYANNYLFLLMWIPNSINPICYAALNERYAKAFKKILGKTYNNVKRLGTSMPSPKSTYSVGLSRRKSSPISV
ncbi:tyramine/octopamine receptor isoform X3 [Exaiptasia diaphana]|uniref:G-protein coupled receptors family 1 profile domain-containing protein n=1 Tax=Exaiptasia diaphana TaxID=2652724 RepID=A0A913YL28_EXADI|nr:tyramine/octopamine receptor isoform X3 [Exaiptasia diaphana]